MASVGEEIVKSGHPFILVRAVYNGFKGCRGPYLDSVSFSGITGADHVAYVMSYPGRIGLIPISTLSRL